MIRCAARAGMLGPFLYGVVVTALTILKYDFLLSLGWQPLSAPTFDWPRGLALGAYDWVMTLTFIKSGRMLTVFASGLRLSLPRSRFTFFSTFTLSLAGLALAGLVFTTDPTLRSTPATWHGRLHELSFVVLGLTFVSAMTLLGVCVAPGCFLAKPLRLFAADSFRVERGRVLCLSVPGIDVV